MQDNNNQHDEIAYEPVPGFRTAFFVIMIVAVVYLATLFFL